MKPIYTTVTLLAVAICACLAGMSLAFIACERWGQCDPADLPHKPATTTIPAPRSTP